MKRLWLLLLAGCTGEANHMGTPLDWAVSGPATIVDNAFYGARRERVRNFLAAEGRGFGPTQLWELSGTPEANRAQVLAELKDLPDTDWVEQATIVVMVYS